MKQLLFEERNGLTEVTLNESLAGAFSKGALVLGYRGILALSAINPAINSSDISRVDNLFGFMFKALDKKFGGGDTKQFSSDIQKMVERMNELNEAGTGKITPETILKVMGKAGELSEDQEKYLVASYYYRKYVERMIEEIEDFDYDEAKEQNESNANAFEQKMEDALKEILEPGSKEAPKEDQKETPEETSQETQQASNSENANQEGQKNG